MPLNVRPGERSVIRRQVFRLMDTAFRVFDGSGAIVACRRQKAFNLRKDL